MQIRRMDGNHNASIQGDIHSFNDTYTGRSRRLPLKSRCYRGAVRHLGRQQGDLRQIENSHMQDCLWLSVQDVPCVQKIRMPSRTKDFLLLMRTSSSSGRSISNKTSSHAFLLRASFLFNVFRSFLILRDRFAA